MKKSFSIILIITSAALIALGFYAGLQSAQPSLDVQSIKHQRWTHFQVQMRTPLERELFWTVEQKIRPCVASTENISSESKDRRLALFEAVEQGERACVREWMEEEARAFRSVSPELKNVLSKMSLLPSTAEHLM